MDWSLCFNWEHWCANAQPTNRSSFGKLVSLKKTSLLKGMSICFGSFLFLNHQLSSWLFWWWYLSFWGLDYCTRLPTYRLNFLKTLNFFHLPIILQWMHEVQFQCFLFEIFDGESQRCQGDRIWFWLTLWRWSPVSSRVDQCCSKLWACSSGTGRPPNQSRPRNHYELAPHTLCLRASGNMFLRWPQRPWIWSIRWNHSQCSPIVPFCSVGNLIIDVKHKFWIRCPKESAHRNRCTPECHWHWFRRWKEQAHRHRWKCICFQCCDLQSTHSKSLKFILFWRNSSSHFHPWGT